MHLNKDTLMEEMTNTKVKLGDMYRRQEHEAGVVYSANYKQLRLKLENDGFRT